MTFRSERLSFFIQKVDSGELDPLPAWFLTAGGFVYGTMVSRSVYEQAFFKQLTFMQLNGENTTMHELLVHDGHQPPEFSETPEILLVNAVINQYEHVACVLLNQEDLISWGIGIATRIENDVA